MLYFKLQPTENNANVIVALDGNFQLRRLKCAGNNIGEQLIKDQFIMRQEQYDQWVNLHDQRPMNSQVSKKKFFKALFIIYCL